MDGVTTVTDRGVQPDVMSLDVERLADALHRAGECRMWPLGDPPMTQREAAARAEVHATRHFITARVVAAEYERLSDDDVTESELRLLDGNR